MAVTYSNQQCSHRGCYFEVVGDGATTALTVNHMRAVPANATASAKVVTAPTAKSERGSNGGGFNFPPSGTSATVSSVSVTSTTVTVNTSAAVANGTKAYVVVLFNQPSFTN